MAQLRRTSPRAAQGWQRHPAAEGTDTVRPGQATLAPTPTEGARPARVVTGGGGDEDRHRRRGSRRPAAGAVSVDANAATGTSEEGGGVEQRSGWPGLARGPAPSRIGVSSHIITQSAHLKFIQCANLCTREKLFCDVPSLGR